MSSDMSNVADVNILGVVEVVEKIEVKVEAKIIPIDLHKKAFLTNFEIACEAAILALVADLVWLSHDIMANGLSLWYIIVFIGLFTGTGLTVFALVRHHKYYTTKKLAPKKNRKQKRAERNSL